MEILVFGKLQEITGSSQLQWNEVTDMYTLRKQLEEKYPLLADVSYRVAVNKVLANDQTVFAAGAEVALLPPFSGG
ncbi:MoaD/ThiS family protein [Chitinophaga sedimenti]|uniref:MoaD/ThiS family protein n=1 Tax=Chitinophaga sedimenti TaxID=2033606 RepID=UPI002005CDFB|nr:MoaD/ThiS family protein [Chitinophaga sedimenti]MCK7556783.1 MoaD/ThiS family protein [Chitinophaga sedimenti]